jgi:threonine aldolase
MQRRSFLTTPALAGLAAAATTMPEDQRVVAWGDGVPLPPSSYAQLLERLSGGLQVDDYSNGGVIAQLEAKVAADLGKERAVWLPTGTLANHLAMRLLAGDRRRVLVQQECHLHNDCGDCCETLSGLHMIGLAPGSATFTLEEAQRMAERGASGRVAVPIGALQIETPVRRKTGEAFDLAEMRKISQWAASEKIGRHLDGARLYLAAAYSGVAVKEYAALFDTVYVSMYKYFNAASGAVLAGPKALLDNLFHTRRMFGGGQHQAWPFAAIALHHFDGFPARYAKAVAGSEQVIAGLQADKRFEIRRVPNGTNIFFLRLPEADAVAFRQRANQAGVEFSAPRNGQFTVQVNETWNRVEPRETLKRIQQARG